jgi:hypothetical protein
MSQRDCNGAFENVSGMSGTEDSSQDDLRNDYATDIWYLDNDINNNRYTDIITNAQLGNQITDREKWDLNNLQLQGVQMKLFQTLNKRKI